LTREMKGMGLFHRHDWTDWKTQSTEKLAKAVEEAGDGNLDIPRQVIEWRMCDGCRTVETRKA
jgi:hypothetical protein